MFLAASKALANQVTEEDLAQGLIYPPLTRIRDVSAAIACSVADIAFDNELAEIEKPADLIGYVRSLMYEPGYEEFV